MTAGPASPSISVVMPTYNRAGLLRNGLRHLARQSLAAEKFEVVVADDGSSDDTARVAQEFADVLRVRYHFQQDRGFRAAAARNAGARLAAAPLLVFLDGGCVPGPDFLSRHLAAHRAAGEPAAVLGYIHGFDPDAEVPGLGAALDRMPAEDVVAHYGDAVAFRDVRHDELAAAGFDLDRLPVPWMMFFTGNCSLPAEAFWRLGGFDETFHGWGAEDMEFAFRLFSAGLPMRFDRQAWVIEAPHERDMPGRMAEFEANMLRFLSKWTEPMIEIGWLTVRDDRIFDWNTDYAYVRDCADRSRSLDVTAEIRAAVRGLPPATRIAVLGAGGELPPELPPSIVMDFDRRLLDRAVAAGRHTGHHAIGLRTPLPEGAADVVVITSRLLPLLERWRAELLAEAHRIGGRVVLPGTVATRGET